MEIVSGFDWDEGNRGKCEGHGVTVSEIESLFSRAVMILPDHAHSAAEERLRAVGRTDGDRYVFLVFTIRERGGKRYVRPISAVSCISGRLTVMKARIPNFKSDDEAARFVETADLTEYDLSGAEPMRFEFEKKGARINMRLPERLLKAVKARADARGIPYQRFIREALERAVGGSQK